MSTEINRERASGRPRAHGQMDRLLRLWLVSLSWKHLWARPPSLPSSPIAAEKHAVAWAGTEMSQSVISLLSPLLADHTAAGQGKQNK